MNQSFQRREKFKNPIEQMGSINTNPEIEV